MSAEHKRQVGIKTRAVKRLAADVRSYVTEHASHELKYRSVSAAGSGADANDVRRAREFVDEAHATLRDVRQRLQESWSALGQFLAEIAVAAPDAADLLADPCVAEARAMLAEVSPLVNAAAAAAAGAAGEVEVRAMRVCVLGDSQLNEDDAMWRPTEQLGEALLRAGFHVVSGGYSGTSEAVSFGASRAAASAGAGAGAGAAAASAAIAGITCPSAFACTPRGGVSGPNQYLTAQIVASDLAARNTALVTGLPHAAAAAAAASSSSSDASSAAAAAAAPVLVVLPGGLGTLAKLTLAWNLAAVESWNQSGGAPSSASRRVILAWRNPWASLLAAIGDALRIPQELQDCVRFVDSVEEAMAQLENIKAERMAAGGASAASSASSSAAAAPSK